jgi:hypothetical protein
LDSDESVAFEKFKLLYKDVSDEDLKKEKDYKILERNNPKNKREVKTCHSYESIIGDELLTRETYLKWLFEKEKLDTRISDSLSVFISLAVDNMKEMQLARIYGNEELLKVPLTLIMLGVDPYDVMLFCKTMLKPVYEAISVNRYNTKKEGLTSLESSAFRGNESLTRVNLPSTVKNIGNSVFENSGTGIVYIDIPSLDGISTGTNWEGNLTLELKKN